MRSLLREDSKEIAVVRDWIANLVLSPSSGCIRDQRIDRTIELVVSTVPIQPVMPSFLADHFPRQLFWAPSRRPRKIFLLRFDQMPARTLCRKFICADAPEHDFVFA